MYIFAQRNTVQLKSVTMVKNHGGALPLQGRLKVWEPLRHVGAGLTHWMKPIEPYDDAILLSFRA